MESDPQLKYRRILLKLSGEVLAGSRSFGIDSDALEALCRRIKTVKELNVEIALVIGGGNIFRGLNASQNGMDRVSADQMGMLATIINSVALQEKFEKLGVPARALSAIAVGEFLETYSRQLAEKYLSEGKLVILAAGTGNPFFSTDTAAALRAGELNADVIMKATKVDGVFSDDPVKCPDAKHYPELEYLDLVRDNLKVMDLTAVTLCRDNRIPIIVFDMNRPDNLKKAVLGEPVGTIIS
ncbi:MAG: UMP kinase [Candidatus Zixiibacteriota bacterium]